MTNNKVVRLLLSLFRWKRNRRNDSFLILDVYFIYCSTVAAHTQSHKEKAINKKPTANIQDFVQVCSVVSRSRASERLYKCNMVEWTLVISPFCPLMNKCCNKLSVMCVARSISSVRFSDDRRGWVAGWMRARAQPSVGFYNNNSSKSKKKKKRERDHTEREKMREGGGDWNE